METLSQAAVLADDYTLTHKNVGRHRLQLPSLLNSQAEPFCPNPDPGGQNQPRENPSGSSRFHPIPNQGLSKGPKCYHCRKRGHVMADCWHLKGPNQGPVKPTMMTVNAHSSTAQRISPTNLCKSMVPQEYKPFLSCRYIYLPESKVKKSITILRDTGANQSLLLEGTVPLSEKTSTGTDVLIQGVEVEPISVPLHKVTLQSNLISGVVTVGI